MKIQTYTGREIDLFNLSPEDIDIEDVAHSLSLQTRFNGHVREFYSVATHSILVSELLPKEYKLAGLLHDASEAYVGDLPAPIKAELKQFQEIEKIVADTICHAFKLDIMAFQSDLVMQADKLALEIESAELMHNPIHVGGAIKGMVGKNPFQNLGIDESKSTFLKTFNLLRTL